jgi:hypothetical protein
MPGFILNELLDSGPPQTRHFPDAGGVDAVHEFDAVSRFGGNAGLRQAPLLAQVALICRDILEKSRRRHAGITLREMAGDLEMCGKP